MKFDGIRSVENLDIVRAGETNGVSFSHGYSGIDIRVVDSCEL